MCVDLTKCRHLVGWEDHLTEASLASVGDVFGVDKEAVLPKRLLAKNSQDPKRLGSEAVCQKLTTRVVSFEARLETRFSFEKQSGVDSTLRRQRHSLITNSVTVFGVSESISGKKFYYVVRKPSVGFKPPTFDRPVHVGKLEVGAIE